MMKKLSLLVIVMALLATAGCQRGLQQPNVMFVLIDDLGWTDLGG